MPSKGSKERGGRKTTLAQMPPSGENHALPCLPLPCDCFSANTVKPCGAPAFAICAATSLVDVHSSRIRSDCPIFDVRNLESNESDSISDTFRPPLFAKE